MRVAIALGNHPLVDWHDVERLSTHALFARGRLGHVVTLSHLIEDSLSRVHDKLFVRLDLRWLMHHSDRAR